MREGSATMGRKPGSYVIRISRHASTMLFQRFLSNILNQGEIHLANQND